MTPEALQYSSSTPMRVGYLLRMYPRFSQTFIVNEIRELERQGMDLSVFSLRLPNEGRFHESVCRVKARAHYGPVPPHGALGSFVTSHWQCARRSARQYARAVRVIRADAQAEAFDMARALALLRWTRKHAITHVHVHFGTSEATVALLAHIFGGVSYSLTLHAFDIFRQNVNRALLADKINASRFTVTVSDFNRRFLVENIPGVNPGRIRVNYNGVDLHRFKPAPTARDVCTIFGVGRLKEKKGFIHLVRAAKRLRDEGLTVKCRIAGEGEEEKQLRREIRQTGLDGQVELLGEVGEQRICQLMASCSCFVLPCIQAADGNIDALPTVLLEAMACGCPVVSTRLSGIPEIIEDGISGLLTEPGNDRRLADAIHRILSDSNLAVSLGRGARRRAEDRFDIRRNVATMLDWFRNEAGRSPGRHIEGATGAEKIPKPKGRDTVVVAQPP